MPIVLFEDELATQLYPITVGRAAFQISCGSFRLIDLVEMVNAESCLPPIALRVRSHLRTVCAADRMESSSIGPAGAAEPTLLVNARLTPRAQLIGQLKEVLAAGRPCKVESSEGMALALLPAGVELPAEDAGPAALSALVAAHNLPTAELDLPMFAYPHDVVRQNLSILSENLRHRLATQTYREIADGIFAAEGATLGQYVVADTRKGPIVLEKGATVGPYCFLSGPAHLGQGARVIEHAAIKDNVSLGHTTKIGGEIEGSVIEPYTNKQHHGFLGHSYLGSWVNLGAGTCNSDLKNTYGQVNMEYLGRKVATGMQFIGTIVGDYSKTAINTGIFTGKTIGACSMVYGFVTTNVPSFVNYARLFGQVTEAPAEVMVATQARMFARRNVTQRPCDIQLIHDMYELTRHERQLAGEPLSL
ncbi:MAG TPA: putative sugar nucleotidyl transferase [Pirellulales bacterium]|jgi:glucose-1-phosphate thymidylyltransferase